MQTHVNHLTLFITTSTPEATPTPVRKWQRQKLKIPKLIFKYKVVELLLNGENTFLSACL